MGRLRQMVTPPGVVTKVDPGAVLALIEEAERLECKSNRPAKGIAQTWASWMKARGYDVQTGAVAITSKVDYARFSPRPKLLIADWRIPEGSMYLLHSIADFRNLVLP